MPTIPSPYREENLNKNIAINEGKKGQPYRKFVEKDQRTYNICQFFNERHGRWVK